MSAAFLHHAVLQCLFLILNSHRYIMLLVCLYVTLECYSYGVRQSGHGYVKKLGFDSNSFILTFFFFFNANAFQLVIPKRILPVLSIASYYESNALVTYYKLLIFSQVSRDIQDSNNIIILSESLPLPRRLPDLQILHIHFP
jgi:hypothetical protein